MGMSSVFKENSEAGMWQGLYGGPERLLHEAVKVKPALHWRPQDSGDARVTKHLPSRAADKDVEPARERAM